MSTAPCRHGPPTKYSWMSGTATSSKPCCLWRNRSGSKHDSSSRRRLTHFAHNQAKTYFWFWYKGPTACHVEPICRAYPTVTSKMLLPTELDTAISPKPFLATMTLVMRSGILVPAARNVSPMACRAEGLRFHSRLWCGGSTQTIPQCQNVRIQVFCPNHGIHWTWKNLRQIGMSSHSPFRVCQMLFQWQTPTSSSKRRSQLSTEYSL